VIAYTFILFGDLGKQLLVSRRSRNNFVETAHLKISIGAGFFPPSPKNIYA
jgi:hypothetical protein